MINSLDIMLNRNHNFVTSDSSKSVAAYKMARLSNSES